MRDYGLEKVVPDDDLLGEAYQAFHRSRRLQDIFEEAESEFDETEDEIDVPDDLKEQVREILKKHNDLRWDDAVQVALDETQLDHVREEKKKRKDKAGDFVDTDDEARAMSLRRRLPDRRPCETFEFETGGLRYVCSVGRFADGTVGEIFLTNHRVNTQAGIMASDQAMLASQALQHGASLATLSRAVMRDERKSKNGSPQ